jgi:hypothetical protein
LGALNFGTLILLGIPLILCGCEALGLSPPNQDASAPDQNMTPAAAPAPVEATAPVPAPEDSRVPWYAPTAASVPAANHYNDNTAMGTTTVGKTAVGKKADAIRAQLDQLEADTNGAVASLNDLRQKSQSISSSYFSAVADINSRLQVGTTPGNPHLVQHWQEASADLDQFSAIGNQMSQLSNSVANDASQVSYLLDETRAAFGLSGAVDEDHDALKGLEDELQKTEIQVTRTREELARQIDRHNDYVAGERRNLETLSLAIARGEYYGQNLTNIRAYGGEHDFAPISMNGHMPMSPPTRAGMLTAPSVTGTPFVVIRFNRPNVDYGSPLYQAMSTALKKNPAGDFDVLAVSPADGGMHGPSAYQRAEEVVSSMAEMGVPRDRVRITTTSKPSVTAPEVQIFLR